MCQVLIDDKLVLSCLYLAKNATGHKIVTAESLAHDNAPWDPIATAFAKNNALQCGFCTPSFMLSTKALLAKYPKPTIAQVQEGLSGVLCICSTYTKAMQTVMKLGGG
jgi:carbon-monoxide dehydrogenase small subunit